MKVLTHVLISSLFLNTTHQANIDTNNDAGVCGAIVAFSVVGRDNCAGSTITQTAGVASGATFPVGMTTNTFTVTAANGQLASCSFDVTVTQADLKISMSGPAAVAPGVFHSRSVKMFMSPCIMFFQNANYYERCCGVVISYERRLGRIRTCGQERRSVCQAGDCQQRAVGVAHRLSHDVQRCNARRVMRQGGERQ